jgi:hypothetical protein
MKCLRHVRALGCAAAVGVLLLAAACADPGSPGMSSPTAPGGASAIIEPNPPEEPPPPPPPPPPTGGEGCTPGYWKQDQHSWPAPYTPSMAFSDVFEDAFGDMTLLEVLNQGGGGLNALGRHTVAALLNAGSGGVDYDLTTAEVISAFNSVFPDGDYERLKNALESFNVQGCPLD